MKTKPEAHTPSHLTAYHRYCLLGLLALYLLAFAATGNLRGGYSLVDDHTTLELRRDFDAAGFYPTLVKWTVEDAKTRLRPLYYILYGTESYLFGIGAARAWNALAWLLATIALLYGALWRLGVRPLYATCAVLLVLAGPQLSAYTMWAAQERYGMLFVALALYVAATAAARPGYGSWLDVGFYATTLLVGLQKESFLLVVPTLIAVRLAIVYGKRESIRWRVVAVHGIGALTVCAVLGAAVLYFLTNRPTLDVGYAGVASFNWRSFLKLVVNEYYMYQLSIAPVILLIGLSWVAGTPTVLAQKRIVRWGRHKVGVAVPVGLFLLGFLPQLALHTQSGFRGRYYLPAHLVLWCVVFVVLEWYAIGASLRRNRRLRYLQLFCLWLLTGVSLWHGYRVLASASAERSTNAALFEAIALQKSNAPLLIVGKPNFVDYERLLATKTYLELHEKADYPIRFLDVTQPTDPATPFERTLRNQFQNQPVVLLLADSAVCAYPRLLFLRERHFEELAAVWSCPGALQNAYSLQTVDEFGVATRKPLD